ncbi:MAG: hypothetical protein C4548_06895 [Desulfobacteraceae bacterium]|nr:MAG: hypothetical protein C4548_06895 [Desulfobacteraceae bacterium]
MVCVINRFPSVGACRTENILHATGGDAALLFHNVVSKMKIVTRKMKKNFTLFIRYVKLGP